MAAIGSKRRRQRPSGRKFVQLWANVKRSEAYHSLSVYARCALIELLDRYNGINNGMIGLGVRELADELGCATGTACKALHELDDAGLIRPVTGGKWKGKVATEWRIMFYRCDETGDLPIRTWRPRQVFTRESTKVHLVGHKTPNCSPDDTHTPENPMNDPAKCSGGDTHINIYQGGTGTQQVQPQAKQQARDPDPAHDLEIPAFLRRRGPTNMA